MIIDSIDIGFFSLHAVTEVYVSDRQGEESDGNCDPYQILHTVLL
jgi:hypothetical protein